MPALLGHTDDWLEEEPIIEIGMERELGVRYAYFDLPCPTTVATFTRFAAEDHCEIFDSPSL